ncbi:MAG: hypothetical protein CTY12_00025 [Methylotenera sp.]|nr:MAG: hypothetical protein CTY12_00025 [Methylotenera sp.]
MATKILTVHFTSSGIPQVGLTPVIDIFELDATNPLLNTHVVTAAATVEVGLGWYRYNFTSYNPTKNYVFTFDGGNTLIDCDRYKIGGNESYVEEISSQVWEEQSTDHLNAGTTGFLFTQIKSDTTSIMVSQGTITSLVNTLLKYERNRTKIDTANATLTIFDDDCTTPLTVFNLRDHLGNPSIQEVCERAPTTCP